MYKIFAIFLILFLWCGMSWAGVDFDGVDDSINCGSGSSIDNLHQSTMTVSVWVEGTFDTTFRRVCNKGTDDVTSGWLIAYQLSSGQNRVNFYVRWSGAEAQWRYISGSSAMTNIVITYDGSSTSNNPIIYINGSSVTTTEITAPSGNVTDDKDENLVIGNRNDGTRCFLGEVNEFKIWNTILTPAQVLQEYNGKLKTMYHLQSNNKLYLPMDDQPSGTSADGDTVRDLSGNGNNGTGNDGANNTGLTWVGESVLSYVPGVIGN